MSKNWKPIITCALCVALVYLLIDGFGPIGTVIVGILKLLFGSLKAIIELILLICGIVVLVKIVSKKGNKK